MLNLLSGRFTFQNLTEQINPHNWIHRYNNHLWNYHLHYFDYVVWAAKAFVKDDREPMRCCQYLIQWWIDQTDVHRGDGWNPYPLSLRVVNWIYAYTLVAETYDDQVFLDRWRRSIYRQLDFLSRHVEFHLLANHLLKNLKALTIGYLFFDRKDQLRQWEKLLWKEFEEQVLSDGGHYERSPMYHAQALADFLECFALLNAFNHFPPSGDIQRHLRLMTQFLDEVTYEDGTFALFNDSASTEETRPQTIIQSAKAICGYLPGKKKGKFPETGYFIWDWRSRKEKIIIDAGPPSVDYNPGHAHCDMLSYELWLCGRHFIVDSGVHGYDGDLYRDYCRSTRAHNTVMFDDYEQSQPWDTFKMARRAKFLGAGANWDDNGTFTFEGRYQRYNSGVFGLFDKSVIHQRYITRRHWGEWMIADIALKGKMERAWSFIHLHPNWKATKLSESLIKCESGGSQVLIEGFAEDPDPGEDVFVELFKGRENPIQGWFFPDFGAKKPAYTIRFRFEVHTNNKFGYKIRIVAEK